MCADRGLPAGREPPHGGEMSVGKNVKVAGSRQAALGLEVDVEVRILVPRAVNFLRAEGLNATIPISVCSDAVLKEIGEAWTEKLIERARQMRAEDGRDAEAGGR